MPETILITLTLNGSQRSFRVRPGRRLLDLLREQAGLTGSKEGCGAGECGACTVLLDGKPVPSCLTLAASCDGHSVITIEGLATPSSRHPLIDAMVEHGGVQCGFCTPGLVMTGAAALGEGVSDRHELARRLSGNLCRCTGYTKVLEAMTSVAAEGDHD